MATVSSSDIQALQSLAQRVALLQPSTSDHIHLVAFTAGALYSLARAIQCRFDDSRMKPDLDEAPRELAKVLNRISASKEPPNPWLSGYFIDSAMLRLDALGEKLGKKIGPRHPLGPEVPQAVNDMKHTPDARIAEGWDVRFSHVLHEAEQVVALLEKAVPGPKKAAV
jgi:hypothetical protein